MPVTLSRLAASQLTGREPARAWDDYCARNPAATPYHLWAWGRAVATVLKHEPHYLYAEAGGRITGVLPLFLRKSRLFGTNLVSVPAANVGGPLADDDATTVRLVEGAVALAGELNVDFLCCEMCCRQVLARARSDWIRRHDRRHRPRGRRGGRLDPVEGHEEMVRRAQDGTTAGSTATSAFYGTYTSTMKRLGSPPFALRFFAELTAGFGDAPQVGVAAVRAWPRST
jgi:hypothetical protein